MLSGVPPHRQRHGFCDQHPVGKHRDGGFFSIRNLTPALSQGEGGGFCNDSIHERIIEVQWYCDIEFYGNTLTGRNREVLYR